MACDPILQTFKIDSSKELQRKPLEALEKMFSCEDMSLLCQQVQEGR